MGAVFKNYKLNRSALREADYMGRDRSPRPILVVIETSSAFHVDARGEAH